MKQYLPNTKMPKVSIVIVNFNTKNLVEDCVESINNSKPKTEYEIIVVDNSTLENQKVKSNNPKVLIIDNDENLGFAKANNIGIKKASGEYVLLLNSDTLVRKNAIDKLVEFAENTPEAGVVGAKLLNKDGSVQGSVYKDPTLTRTIRQYWLGKKGLLEKHAPNSKKAVPVENTVMAAFLITPKAIKEVGLLNEKYFMYFEDLDYCRRVRKARLKVYYLPEAEVVHLHGRSGKKLTDDNNQWRRLIPSSIIYHGLIKHYLIYIVMWAGQKLRNV